MLAKRARTAVARRKKAMGWPSDATPEPSDEEEASDKEEAPAVDPKVPSGADGDGEGGDDDD